MDTGVNLEKKVENKTKSKIENLKKKFLKIFNYLL